MSSFKIKRKIDLEILRAWEFRLVGICSKFNREVDGFNEISKSFNEFSIIEQEVKGRILSTKSNFQTQSRLQFPEDSADAQPGQRDNSKCY